MEAKLFEPNLRLVPVEWRVSDTLGDYPAAVEVMERRVAQIADGPAAELGWLLEHPPVYTAGTSANPSDLLSARCPVFKTGRGRQVTYPGTGPRLAWVT